MTPFKTQAATLRAFQELIAPHVTPELREAFDSNDMLDYFLRALELQSEILELCAKGQVIESEADMFKRMGSIAS